MNAALQIVGRKNPAVLPVSSRFGVFKPEHEQNTRAQKVESNAILDEMEKTWNAFYFRTRHCEQQIVYFQGAPLIRKKYSAKDIEMFSLSLIDLPKRDWFYGSIGFFLSALINRSDNSKFILHMGNLNEPISNLGYMNSKSIVIIGSVGDSVGDEMNGGSLVVRGNARDNAGMWLNGGIITIEGDTGDNLGNLMKRGLIIVKKSASDMMGDGMSSGKIIVNMDAGTHAGWDMKGGVITVKGDTGEDVGNGMENGTIRINGQYGGISELFHGGRIFHKRKLILDK